MTGLVFVACFFVGCCLAFVRHPIFGLLTYVATYYLHPPSRWWGKVIPDLRWSLLAAVITMIAVLVHKNKLAKPAINPGKPLLIGFGLFFVWLLIQSTWAYEQDMHTELIVLYAKYMLLIWLITTTIDSEKHLQWFCWTHVLGCLYLGWVAYSEYDGGRFEGFGGPDINEANAGALQIVSGIFTGAALFLLPPVRQKLAVLFSMPLIVNAMVLTSSRSAFLASAAGGLMFNLFSPKKFRWLIRIGSVLAVVMFVMLTNPEYWTRIGSIKEAGADVQGVDTGSGRLVLMQQQLQMFSAHPMGCGHRCTVTLSPQYMDESMLTGTGEKKGRASHNTFMSLLVEQGLIGAIFYVLYLFWLAGQILKLRRNTVATEGLLSTLTPALVAFLTAVTVGDMFVDYLKSEVRIWFIALLVVSVALSARQKISASVPLAAESSQPRKNPLPIS